MIIPVYHTRRFRHDSMLAFIVLILPFMGYIHLIFTGNETSIWIFGFQLQSEFPNISIHVWYFLSKIIPILLLSIWFFNCNIWWRYFIFSPILLNSFTLSSNGFNFQNLDSEWHWFYAALFSVAILISIVVIDLIYYGNSHQKRINRSFYGIFEEREFYKEICKRYEEIRSRKLEFDENNYSYKLYYIRTVLKKKISKFESISSRIINERYSKTCNFLGVIVLLIPLLFYSNNLVPVGLKKVTFLGISSGANGFHDINTFYWFLLLKICIIIPLIIWFVTTSYWWKYAILSPIILFTYQLWEATLDITDLDSYSNIKILPLIIFVLVLVLMLAKLTRYIARIMELYSEINEELDIIIYNLALTSDKNLMSLIKEYSMINRSKDKNRRFSNMIDLFEYREKLMLKIKNGT